MSRTHIQRPMGSIGEIMTYIPHSTHDDERAASLFSCNGSAYFQKRIRFLCLLGNQASKTRNQD